MNVMHEILFNKEIFAYRFCLILREFSMRKFFNSIVNHIYLLEHDAYSFKTFSIRCKMWVEISRKNRSLVKCLWIQALTFSKSYTSVSRTFLCSKSTQPVRAINNIIPTRIFVLAILLYVTSKQCFFLLEIAVLPWTCYTTGHFMSSGLILESCLT